VDGEDEELAGQWFVDDAAEEGLSSCQKAVGKVTYTFSSRP